jgi:ABC-type bacteriocin/lantibiotic exporter with double-glycine peptidase domain
MFKVFELRNLTYTANMVAQGAVLLATGLLVLNHQLTIGTLMSIANFSSLIFSQLVNVTSQIGSIKSTRSLADSVMKEIKELPNSEKKEDSLTNFDTLSTHGLVLQYPNGEKIQYPDIQIKAGEKVLLSGDSGTGKSTLFKMILNEIKPTQGKIVFKDKLGKILNPDYSQIGYIPQDPVVFPGTIEDNITMFNSKLNKKAANWAQKVQLATDFEKFLMVLKLS